MHTNTGVTLSGDRLLVLFRNQFGKLLQKTLLFYNTANGQVEYRGQDDIVPVGVVTEFNGVKYILIPIIPAG